MRGKERKKMYSLDFNEVKNPVVEFTPPVYHSGKQCYVDFSIVDPSTGRMRRKKYMLDKYKGKRAKQLMAAQIISNIYQKVLRGWNPWTDIPNSRGDVLFSDVVKRYRTYINSLVRKGVMKEKTRYDYLSRLRILSEYIEDRTSGNLRVYQFNLTCMTDFLDYILLDRDSSSRTRNNYRTWLSALCSWMVSRQYLVSNQVSELPTLPESVKFRSALPEDHIKQLVAYLEKNDKRFLLACMMEYYTFIRPTELVKIRIKDISVKNQTVFVSSAISKNRKDGCVALNDRIIKMMIELSVFSHPGDEYLFGPRMFPSTERASSRIFRERFSVIRQQLNFPMSYQFYSLKDSGIRDLANSQGIVVAKEQARHSDISVTNSYLVGKDKQVNEKTKHFKGAM